MIFVNNRIVDIDHPDIHLQKNTQYFFRLKKMNENIEWFKEKYHPNKKIYSKKKYKKNVFGWCWKGGNIMNTAQKKTNM